MRALSKVCGLLEREGRGRKESSGRKGAGPPQSTPPFIIIIIVTAPPPPDGPVRPARGPNGSKRRAQAGGGGGAFKARARRAAAAARGARAPALFIVGGVVVSERGSNRRQDQHRHQQHLPTKQNQRPSRQGREKNKCVSVACVRRAMGCVVLCARARAHARTRPCQSSQQKNSPRRSRPQDYTRLERRAQTSKRRGAREGEQMGRGGRQKTEVVAKG